MMVSWCHWLKLSRGKRRGEINCPQYLKAISIHFSLCTGSKYLPDENRFFLMWNKKKCFSTSLLNCIYHNNNKYHVGWGWRWGGTGWRSINLLYCFITTIKICFLFKTNHLMLIKFKQKMFKRKFKQDK